MADFDHLSLQTCWIAFQNWLSKMLSKMKTIQEFLDHEKRFFKKQVEERKKEDKKKVELCKSRFARSIEMMDEDTKKTFYHPSQEPTIGAMKAFYLEIYPVLDEKLDETEAERVTKTRDLGLVAVLYISVILKNSRLLSICHVRW